MSIPRRRRSAIWQICGLLGALASTAAAQGAQTVFYSTSYVACAEQLCPPHSLAWSSEQFNQIYLVDNGGQPPSLQPLTLSAEALAKVLESLQVTSHGTAATLFDKESAASFARGLSVAFTKATPSQDLLFMITAHVDTGGLLNRQLGNSGRAWLDQKGLNLAFSEVQVDFVGPYEAVRKVRLFDFGSRQRASAVTLGPDGADHPRPDTAVIGLATQVDPTTGQDLVIPIMAAARERSAAPRAAVSSPYPMVDAQGRPVSATGAVPVAPAASPASAGTSSVSPAAPISADAAERRLQTLQRLHDKGLISDQEYQAKRQQVLDGL